MPIPIPYAMSYTATAGATVWKLVECEHCKSLFGYQMKRQAEGESLSVLFLDNAGAQERAVETARQNLIRQLERDFDPVPCPQCAKYQSYMRWRVRWSRWTESVLPVFLALPIVLGLLLLGVGFIFFFHSNYNYNPDIPYYLRICWGTAAVVGGIPILALLMFAFRCMWYDPNNPAEEPKRMGLAHGFAISGDALQKVLTEMAASIAKARGKN
jgi:hypothetical protein